MDKKILRKNYLNLRKKTFNETINKKIISNFYNSKLCNASKSIMVYVSYNEEINTHDLISKLLSNDKEVITPFCNTIDHTLLLYKIYNFPKDFTKNVYGILEVIPDKGELVSEDSLDLIIVPGLAFTPKGYRLGYGGGYYDRLLNSINQKNCKTVGLIRESFIVDDLPIELHDKKVDFLITEKRVLKTLL